MTHCPNCNAVMPIAHRDAFSATWRKVCIECGWASEPFKEPEQSGQSEHPEPERMPCGPSAERMDA